MLNSEEKINQIDQIEDYTVTHVGDGKFKVNLENGVIKDAGDILCGMIRYTYFEDYCLPEIGWNTTRKQLYRDYLPKLQKAMMNGEIDLTK